MTILSFPTFQNQQWEYTMKVIDEHTAVLNDPWSQHHLTIIRDTGSSKPAKLMAIELVADALLKAALQRMPTVLRKISTPTADDVMMPAINPFHTISMVNVMRAGIGFNTAMMRLRQAGLPVEHEIYLEAERDEKTLLAKKLACKLPHVMNSDHGMFGEPMCATGGSTILALDIIHERLSQPESQQITCMHFFATREGLTAVREKYPHVRQICAAIDPELNDKGYIVPGCGDFGDILTGVVPA